MQYLSTPEKDLHYYQQRSSINQDSDGATVSATAAAQPSPICLARRGLGIPGYVNERQLCLQIGNLPINAFQLAQLRLGGL